MSTFEDENQVCNTLKESSHALITVTLSSGLQRISKLACFCMKSVGSCILGSVIRKGGGKMRITDTSKGWELVSGWWERYATNI